MGRSKFKTVHTSKRSGPRAVDPKDAKIGKIDTWEDIADEEDQFHMGRDKVDLSLDDYPLPKAHVGRDVFDDPSDEEVLDLEGLPSSDDDDDDDEDDYEDGDVLGDRNQAYSDEEEEEEAGGKDGDGYGRWGEGRNAYYGANTLEDGDDQKLEEEEAAEMIRHQYDGVKESDFFFDEEDYEMATGKKDGSKKKESWKDGGSAGGVVGAKDALSLDTLKVALPESPEERRKLLYQVHPEFEKLAKEFTALMPLLEGYEVEISAGDGFGTSVRHAKFIALSAHLGVLSMYFALMVEERPAGEMANLGDHKVMQTLKKTRRTWEKVQDMEEEEDDDDDEEAWEEMEEDAAPLQIEAAKPLTNGKSSMANGLAAVEKLMAKESAKTAAAAAAKNKKRKRTSEEHEHQPLSSRRKSRKASRQVEEGLSDLADLLKAPPKRLKSVLKKPNDVMAKATNNNDDFAEDTHLRADDAEEKAKRKKSLRFYTSQIVQRSDKRGRAGRDAGGDMDIPHRERERDRRDRLNAEARKRGMASAPGADLDGADMDEDDVRVSKEIRGEPNNDGAADNSDAEYYEMYAAKSKHNKQMKKLLHDAEKAGSKVIETEEIDPTTGKRAIGYTIEKNKGLTPHRKKDVRNPRVKKRKKYEQAKKKLSSTRAVYKTPTAAYGGEQTGIKTKLVKSIKFK